MKRTTYILTFAAVSVGLPLFAYAGYKHLEPVLIMEDGYRSYDGHAEASVSGAIAAPNNIDYFRCWAQDGVARCYFRDASYNGAHCWTNDPDHVASIATVGAASYVSVSWDEGLGNWCRTVVVYNGSAYVP